MDLDDQITLATPEGVELQVVLAGLGSRFIAGSLDLVIQIVAIVILAMITGLFAGSLHGALVAAFVVGNFVIWFFYPVLFEVLNAGRTPGKLAAHLRVVRSSGAPVDLAASAIRNLVRVLDGPTLLYVPSVIGIAVTRKHQRPGDLAAGTVVIRDDPLRAGAADAPTEEWVQESAGWDASAVSAEEMAAVRQFLERRDTLAFAARRDLAIRLAHGLCPKVTGAPTDPDPERFLQALAVHKRRR